MSNKQRENIFNQFSFLGMKVKNLGSIVQNEDMYPTEEQLLEWIDLVNSCINEINSLKEEVVQHIILEKIKFMYMNNKNI